MLNDQRRHLAEHFESIDLNRLEYHLPFFDSEFVASVLKVPVEMCLGHRLYMRWLRHFPEAVLSVPWQAYPGHEPCPLPIPRDLGYQWEEAEATKVRDAHRHDLLRQASLMLNASDFPDPLFRKHYLRLAAWVYRLRMRDVGHVIRAAHMYYRYWSECGGKYLRPLPYSVG
jgi:asparagine synthase (glutamine-hydrolysing)